MAGARNEDVSAARRRFDMADAAPLLLDAGMTVTSWTADADQPAGVRALRGPGRRAVELLLPEDAARIPDLVARCRDGGGWAGLLSALHRDGHAVRVMVRAVPIRRIAAGRRAGWCCSPIWRVAPAGTSAGRCWSG